MKFISLSSCVFTLFLMLMISCGFQKPEEDKHPEVPLFPQLSNSDFILETFPFDILRLTRTSHFIIASVYDSVSKSHPTLVFDLNLKLKKRFENLNVFLVTNQDEIFALENEQYVRYASPFSSKQVLNFEIISSVQDSLRAIQIAKSTKDTSDKIALAQTVLDLTHTHYQKKYCQNLVCITEINANTFMFQDKKGLNIYQFESYDFDTKKMEIPICTSAAALQIETLTFYDKIHTGYSVDGSNHIAFGVNADELYYYSVVIDGDSLSFKDSYANMGLYETPQHDVFISDGKHQFWKITKK